MISVTQEVIVIRRYKYLLGILSIIVVALCIFFTVAVISILKYSKIAASPYESTPEEVAFAFSYLLDKDDFDGATALYDDFSDSTVTVENIDDLRGAVGLPEKCNLAAHKVEDIHSRIVGEAIVVAVPHVCSGKLVSHEIYVSNGSWETPNGVGKFVVSEAAGKAGHPL